MEIIKHLKTIDTNIIRKGDLISVKWLDKGELTDKFYYGMISGVSPSIITVTLYVNDNFDMYEITIDEIENKEVMFETSKELSNTLIKVNFPRPDYGGCNNEYCYWNGFGSCCHESEEGHDNAVPNTLDCPSSLRKDFETQFWILLDEIKALLNKRYFRQLVDVRKFLLDQEKE